MAVLCGGCTADLMVYDNAGALAKGVPFRTAEVYVAEGYLTAHSTGGTCNEKTRYQKFVSLPLGDQYFAHIETGEWTGSEFSISYNDNGGLKEVSLNSEPKFADNLGAITDFVSKAVPALVPTPAAGTAETALRDDRACDRGESLQILTKLSEWTTWPPD